MTTTIKDLGLNTQDPDKIPFFYAFPFKFWFQQHQIAPEDVLTWCRQNCKGFYKVSGYTFKDSLRILVAVAEDARRLTDWIEAHPGTTPEEAAEWVKANIAEGEYRIETFNKKLGERIKAKFYEIPVRRVYVDKIYLSEDADAANVKLHFDVSDQQVKRPDKLKNAKRRKRKTY